MKVILLKDVPKVGQKNDIKEVSDGYALNLLFPKGLAKLATDGAIKNIELSKSREEAHQKASLDELEKKVAENENIKIKVRANEKGHLFAGIGKEEISKASNIAKENILLDSPLKELGVHEVKIKIGIKILKIKVLLES